MTVTEAPLRRDDEQTDDNASKRVSFLEEGFEQLMVSFFRYNLYLLKDLCGMEKYLLSSEMVYF